MASMEVTFFATIDEIIQIVPPWLDLPGVNAVAVELGPFTVLPVTAEGIEEHLRRERVREIIFAEGSIDVSGTDQLQFLDRNEGVLILQIGRLGPTCLEESRVSTLRATPCWRKIANAVRKHTTAGMIGTHDETGAAATYRTCRYTEGAALLGRSGTPLRQFAPMAVRYRPVASPLPRDRKSVV